MTIDRNLGLIQAATSDQFINSMAALNNKPIQKLQMDTSDFLGRIIQEPDCLASRVFVWHH